MRAWHLVCLANCPPPDEVGAVECDNRLGPAAHLPVVVEVSTQLGTLPVADCCSTPDQRDLTLHCYFTGPFLLLGAVVTLTYGLGVLPLGPDRWGSIGLVVAAGSCFLCCVPGWVWGKYVTRARPAGG